MTIQVDIRHDVEEDQYKAEAFREKIIWCEIFKG